MARNEIYAGGSHSKCNDSFIDRSNVRILLCDNDARSADEVFTLLCNCSYQGAGVLFLYMFSILSSCF